jgi:Tfp pilus assembly protein PilN
VINLLPPDLKEQIRYAKLNRLTLRYLRLTVGVVVMLGGIFAGAFYLLQLQTTTVAADVTDKQGVIADLNRTFTPKAKDASERLNAIKFVQSTQTRFSQVVADIAKVLPQGVSIDSMTLTGDDKKSMRVGVTAQSYDGALAFRNALLTSPRIAGADIESINQASTAGFKASVVVGFKPGQAK